MTLDEALTHATLPVQTAGHIFFGLGRNAAYEAAKRGDFETIKIGGKIVVPVAPIAAKLGSGVVRAEEFNSILEGALPISAVAAHGAEPAVAAEPVGRMAGTTGKPRERFPHLHGVSEKPMLPDHLSERIVADRGELRQGERQPAHYPPSAWRFSGVRWYVFGVPK